MPRPTEGYIRFPRHMARAAISDCSLAAQGLWARLEDIMHESPRYGFLCHAGKPMPPLMAARRVGLAYAEEYLLLLDELDGAGWIQREPRTNIIFSSSLVCQNKYRSGTRYRQLELERRQRRALRQKSNADAPIREDLPLVMSPLEFATSFMVEHCPAPGDSDPTEVEGFRG